MYRQDEPEVNLEQILEKIRSFNPFRRGGDDGEGGGGNGIAYFVLGLFAVGIVFWLGTGVYTVQPGEEAVIRLVGRYYDTTDPGLHWFWPTPIGKRDVVRVDEVRRLEIGVRGSAPIPDEAQMITGDQNIVDVQLLVQYNIKNSQDFLFKAVDPAGLTIKDAAETSLRQVVGQRAIDDVLTIEKEAVQEDTRLKLQELLDLYQTGIRVTEVKLLNVRPPDQVQDAFDDVVRAREDKDRIINLADAYRESQLPLARGDAARLTEAAQAFRETRVAQATGQADRFLAVLQEYRKAPDVTRQRLYLEAMEEILPGVTKFIVDADNGGNLLQLLPLNEAANTTTPFSVPTPTSN
ncbi:MAG: FtsH protease activity modulator HflK [Chloroflexi bacterium]|nr:FtsH protease activity modulator HflK [Chloroflexota bacterium]